MTVLEEPGTAPQKGHKVKRHGLRYEPRSPVQSRGRRACGCCSSFTGGRSAVTACPGLTCALQVVLVAVMVTHIPFDLKGLSGGSIGMVQNIGLSSDVGF